jgi:cytochrome c2
MFSFSPFMLYPQNKDLNNFSSKPKAILPNPKLWYFFFRTKDPMPFSFQKQTLKKWLSNPSFIVKVTSLATHPFLPHY